MTPGQEPTQRPGRRGYLDWLRGLAVVIMVFWHTVDSWTTAQDKLSGAFWYCMLVGGFAAPIFLFSAGVSTALSTGSRLRRGQSAWDAAWPMVRRGGWIWVLAILFRIQSYVLSGGATLYGILKVDILNGRGPSISLAALILGLGRTAAARVSACLAATCVFAFLTPLVRASGTLEALPDPIEWYFRPWAGRTTFTFFPWAGFVLAGAAVGVLVDRTADREAERRLIVRIAAGGLALWAAAGASSHLPSLVGDSDFWRSAPSFFFIRVAVVVLLIVLAYAWEQRPAVFASGRRFSPMMQFGLTSLFVYWVHVEMAYGGLSKPIRGELRLPVSLVAFALFLTAMLGLSILKTRIAARWRAPRAAEPRPTAGPPVPQS
jgi:uncharacterized membrane protein